MFSLGLSFSKFRSGEHLQGLNMPFWKSAFTPSTDSGRPPKEPSTPKNAISSCSVCSVNEFIKFCYLYTLLFSCTEMGFQWRRFTLRSLLKHTAHAAIIFSFSCVLDFLLCQSESDDPLLVAGSDSDSHATNGEAGSDDVGASPGT
eukprot:TRINITY_DN5224_c0_g1_i1.p1 TRINITY_DN5224_c0_g1~~TRINITY_DN5224_c0_g1_i1.p1  ORF type:complete len:146 (+),score=13.88 TRINITY_DN5224_c0_g1_i1:128-565(+)